MKINRNKFSHFLLGFLFFVTAFKMFPGNDSLAFKNYYIELKNNQKKIEIGYYSEKKCTPKAIYECNLPELTKEKLASLLTVPSDSAESLIYFHCMWGEQKHFHKYTLKGLNNTIEMSSNKNLRTTISIVWHSYSLRYKKNWVHANEKGKKLANIFRWLTEIFPGRTNVLCHSMGNRVFQGIVQETNKNPASKFSINELIFAAPDVNADIFENDYKGLASMAKRIHIFRHGRDRFLMISQLRLQTPRLGRSGPKNSDSLLTSGKNIYLIDATETESWRRPEPSNHIYFHWNPAVKNHLAKIFAHQAFMRDEKTKIIYLYY